MSGFTGEFCQLVTDDCDETNCNSNGQCGDGLAVCDCNDGFIGDNCENRDHCRNITCPGNSMCMNFPDRFTCNCAPDYTGSLCESTIDNCNGVTCNNGGTCVDGIADFTCLCAPDYTGLFCDSTIDNCNGVPCNNGGTCVDGIADFTCLCAPDYTGLFCDSTIDNCNGVTCNNGGTCEDGIADFACLCSGGVTGPVGPVLTGPLFDAIVAISYLQCLHVV